MLRRIVILISIFVVSSFSFASTTTQVRKCIDKAIEASQLDERGTLVKSCYDFAKSFINSNQLEERSLYFEAWHFLLQMEYWSHSNSLKLMNDRLLPYYNSAIKPFIKDTEFSQMRDSTLNSVSFAASYMDFYNKFESLDESIFDQQFLIWNEKLKRNLATTTEAKDILLGLLRLHRWSEAHQLTQQFPMITLQIPHVIENEKPADNELAYYSLSKDHQTLILKKFQFTPGPQIFIVGFCHSAWGAIEMLSAEKETHDLIRNYGKVLIPSIEPDFKKIGELQDQYPDFSFNWTYDLHTWKKNEIEMISSPTFYFFQDGKLKSKINGIKGLLKEFCKHAKGIGLKVSPSCSN